MYGDTEATRRGAARLREQGDQVRRLADELVARAEAVHWSGRAGTALRERVQERAGRLRESAAAHQDAAESLERHGSQVDRVKESIAEREEKVRSRIQEARTRVRALEEADDVREPDPDDLNLTRLTPPPAGHKDWLDLTIPGR